MVECYIYAHYGFGFGHLQRSKLLALALKRLGYNVTLFSSGTKLPQEFIPKEINFIQLESEEPTFIYGKNAPSNKKINRKDMIKMRIREVIKYFNNLEPDIFITEFFPFSPFRLEKTLIPILKNIKSKYPRCLIVSSLRDIPLTRLEKDNFDKKKIKKYLEDYYDLLLVHAKKNMSSFASGRKLNDFKTKVPIRFTGYVSNDKVKRNVSPYQVVISAGGGRDGKEIITKSVNAISNLAKRGVILNTLVVLGPLSGEFPLEHKENINVVKYDPDLFSYIQKADLNISMAGYNTVTELYRSGIPAIIFPRKGSYEQNERVDIISKSRKNISILYEDKTTSKILAKEILNALKKRKYSPLKIEGADETARLVSGFYDKIRKS